jgi:hypothetical protein
MSLTLTLHKRHEKGGATYINPETRARVIIGRRMFAGEAPETVDVEISNLREATEADKERVKKLAAKDATRATKAATLADRVVKAKARAEKLEARLKAHEAAQAAKNPPVEQSSQMEANA